jgi:hypothetical protein
LTIIPDIAALVAHVGEFYITDKAMKRAQTRIERALNAGSVSEAEKAEYLAAVERYFTSFEREARTHLRDVDRRLEHVNQVHFNLTAERGVAVRRIEATQGILAELNSVANAP